MSDIKFFITRDGGSDFLILKSFISSVFLNERSIQLSDGNFVDSEMNIGGSIGKFLDAKNKSDDIKRQRIKELENRIMQILHTIISKGVSNKDVVILNADTENKLERKEKYYEENWINQFYLTVYFAIDKFYERMIEQGYNFDNLPVIIPLILFPSIEILVAACYLSESDKKLMRNLKPNPDLKQKIWKETDMKRAIENGKVSEVLEICFTGKNDSLKDIYKYIPEARNLINILRCPSVT
jgi:hypothetical protein